METRTHINLGSGVKLISEDYYREALGNGISKIGFRRWCKALRVPMLEVGKTRYVDSAVFEMAISSIMRIGGHNQFMPGSLTPSRHPKQVTRPQGVDLDDLDKNWRRVMRELLYKKNLHGAKLTSHVRQHVRDAVDRLREWGVTTAPTMAQTRRDTRLRETEKNGAA